MTYLDVFDAAFDAVTGEVAPAWAFVMARDGVADRVEALHVVLAKAVADAVCACAEEARAERGWRP